MKVNMFTVAAMVLATRASAQCTLPTLPYGTVAAVSKACVAKAALADGATCNIKLMAGYIGSGGDTSYSCSGTSLTPPAVALTGCAANYYQSAGTSASNIECTACAIGKIKAESVSLESTAKCAACVGATAGNCATGCPADFSQNKAATVGDIKCTACAGTTKIVATAYIAAGTTCSSQCTLPTLPYGTVAAVSKACVAKAALADGATCNIKLMAGYIGSGGDTSYSCSGTSLTPPAVSITGCAANYYQSAGTDASNIECTACAIGKIKAESVSLKSTVKCAACVGATAGNCATGCPADFSQNEAATVGDIKCTACAGTTKIVATAYSAAGTSCGATADDASDGPQVKPSGMGFLLTAVGAMTYWK